MEECASTSEQRALAVFAERLGTTVCAEDGIANDGDLRQQAQLLMHLMSSQPQTSSSSRLEEEILLPSPFFDEEPSFIQSTASLHTKKNAFTFSCPSLSLDEEAYRLSRTPTRARTLSDSSEESVPSLMEPPAPGVLLARPLVVDDQNALHLSADAMGRNLLQSFTKAVQWRCDSWVNSLSQKLVIRELELKHQGATEFEIKELVTSTEADVIASIRKATTEITPIEVTTSFKVLPHGTVSEETASGAPPPKKRKVTRTASDRGTKYRVEHGMMFTAVMGLMTPSGYAEVTVEAPGLIEGSFLRLANDDGRLTGVVFELNTEIITAMIEKSSRIVARSAAQAFIEPSEKIPVTKVSPTVEADALRTPQPKAIATAELPAQGKLAIVSPRNSTPTNEEADSEPELAEPTYIPMPKDFSAKHYTRSALRMVSPQPRSPDQSGSPLFLSPQSPKPSSKATGPSLVSPPPSRDVSVSYLKFDASGPKLPALVEVACAAMRTG